MTTEKTTRTICAYCGVGCGVLATALEDGAVSIKGDPEHPANFGRLCSKGLALGETLGLEQRLLHPSVNGVRTSWNEATAAVARNFSEAIRDHGPESVAFYVSGQLLTEDYYVANKMMKGFIGCANIDTNSRLCMASAVAGHNRAFGADIVPCNYSDLEHADLVVLAGSNLAWCHPVLFQRILAEREKRDLKLVVIDPRRTVTAEAADLHLALYPGSDVALFNGLLADLYRQGEIDSRFIFARTSGLAEALLSAKDCTLRAVSEATRLEAGEVQAFYDLFASKPKTVTAFSMGVNQSSAGTDKVNAIINCHLLTGRIGKTGAGPFSITGQPNAMGGREVGGMANMLAAHMDMASESHRAAVKSFWNSPAIASKPGLKAVDLFQAVRDGKIKALWIMATNPAVSMPGSSHIKEALSACPFVVVSDVTANTETAKYADVLLPAMAWGEKDGTVTNSERRISRQRRFLPPAGEAREDWRIICDVATAMGFSGFSYTSPAGIFREHCALTQVENKGTRRFDLAQLQYADDDAYEAMAPFQWGGAIPFANRKFETPDGKARFVATPAKPLAAPVNSEFDLILNTGRIRDQWHTMTRSGLSPRLFRHRAEPHVEISPADAARLGLGHASLARVKGRNGAALARVLISDAMKPGQVFQSMHWSSPFACGAAVNEAILPNVDPLSGQPELKASPVSITAFAVQWYGFGIAAVPIRPSTAYWAWQPHPGGMSFECAGTSLPDWQALIAQFCATGSETDRAVMVTGAVAAQFRYAVFRNGKLRFAFYASDQPIAVSRQWLSGQLGINEASSMEILAGRPLVLEHDQGPIVCACMNVGRNTISTFAERHPGAPLNELCEQTGAGTGCGACRPEILRMMNGKAQHLQAAE